MFLFIPLLFFIFLNTGCVVISKRKFGKCLPVTMLMATFILYITQLVFNSFKIGYIVLAFGSAAGVLFGVYQTFIKKNSKVRENIFSFGLYAFIAVFLIFFIVDFKRSFSTWDELSHWGVMVKEMLRLDSFYSVQESRLLVHKDYPPFVSIFEMLWCKLCGGYSEMAVTMSLNIFTLSLIVPPIADFQEKKIIKQFLSAIILSAILILLIGTFDVYGIFGTIMTDMFMPALYVYAVSLLLDGSAFSDAFDYIGLIVSLSALIISKQMGIAFVLLVYLYYLMFWILNWRKKKQYCFNNDNSCWTIRVKPFVKSAVLFFLPVLSYLSWTKYVSSLNITGQQFSLSKIRIDEITNILLGGGRKLGTAQCI